MLCVCTANVRYLLGIHNYFSYIYTMETEKNLLFGPNGTPGAMAATIQAEAEDLTTRLNDLISEFSDKYPPEHVGIAVITSADNKWDYDLGEKTVVVMPIIDAEWVGLHETVSEDDRVSMNKKLYERGVRKRHGEFTMTLRPDGTEFIDRKDMPA